MCNKGEKSRRRECVYAVSRKEQAHRLRVSAFQKHVQYNTTVNLIIFNTGKAILLMNEMCRRYSTARKAFCFKHNSKCTSL